MTEEKFKPGIKVEIEISIFGRIFRFITEICRLFQSIFPFLFWLILVKPILTFLKNPRYDKLNSKLDQTFKYTVNSDKKLHYVFYKILVSILHLNEWIGGMIPANRMYQKLLVWNPKFPITGYEGGPIKTTIEFLGKKKKDGSRGWDLIWITNPTHIGKFQILDKKYNIDGNKNQIIITCIWITGKNAGKIFEISHKYNPIGNSREKDVLPSHLYAAPVLFAIFFDFILSASLISPLLLLSKEFYKLILSHLIPLFLLWCNVLYKFFFHIFQKHV